MSFSVDETIAKARSAEWTAVLVNREGEITELIGQERLPDAAFIFDLNERFPGAGCFLLPRGDYGPEAIRAKIQDVLEGFRLSDAGLLRSGVNLQ